MSSVPVGRDSEVARAKIKEMLAPAGGRGEGGLESLGMMCLPICSSNGFEDHQLVMSVQVYVLLEGGSGICDTCGSCSCTSCWKSRRSSLS